MAATDLDNARAALARGEGRVSTKESMQKLTREMKERGRARLVTELTSSVCDGKQ